MTSENNFQRDVSHNGILVSERRVDSGAEIAFSIIPECNRTTFHGLTSWLVKWHSTPSVASVTRMQAQMNSEWNKDSRFCMFESIGIVGINISCECLKRAVRD